MPKVPEDFKNLNPRKDIGGIIANSVSQNFDIGMLHLGLQDFEFSVSSSVTEIAKE